MRGFGVRSVNNLSDSSEPGNFSDWLRWTRFHKTNRIHKDLTYSSSQQVAADDGVEADIFVIGHSTNNFKV